MAQHLPLESIVSEIERKVWSRILSWRAPQVMLVYLAARLPDMDVSTAGGVVGLPKKALHSRRWRGTRSPSVGKTKAAATHDLLDLIGVLVDENGQSLLRLHPERSCGCKTNRGLHVAGIAAKPSLFHSLPRRDRPELGRWGLLQVTCWTLVLASFANELGTINR